MAMDAIGAHHAAAHARADQHLLHIVVAGPIAGDDVAAYLSPDQRLQVPAGYLGAPLTAVLIGEFLRMGHRVTAITHDTRLPLAGGVCVRTGPNFSFEVCPARPRAWRFNGYLPGRAVDGFAHERRLIRQQMLAAAPDVVHAHWTYEFALAALAQPAPHLITCHDAPGVVLRLNRNLYRAVRYLMARRVFRKGRAFTTVSDYMARQLASVLPTATVIIPNPVAPLAFTLGRERVRPVTRRVVMVCNGWSRLKNPEPGLRGFALWRRTEPTAELHLYGADFGPGESAQAWAQAQGLADGVFFHGRMPHAQLLVRMAEADVLLHTSLEESFGVVLSEAMALGLPVVAGRASGAVPWVLGMDAAGHVACGATINVSDPAGIRSALDAVFQQGYPAMSRAGRRRAEESFAATAVAQLYLKAYRTAVDLHAGLQRSARPSRTSEKT